jgi:LPXTG-motif cell wall-anchored protein
MHERSSQVWRVTLGLGAMVAGGVILVGTLPGYAGASGAQTDATTSTSLVEGNPTCGDLAPEGASWTEFKVEPVESGTFTDGTLSVTITVTDTDDGPVFDWTSNIGVDAVFVKGGPGGLLYVYDPPAESTGDTGLHAPVNPNNDKFFGLSHVSFCYDKDQATTTTTQRDTTTTTEHETTTTTEHGTTTTTEHGTTTTVQQGGTSTTARAAGTTPTTQPAGGLPRTGSNSVPLLAVGAALLCGGTALVAATRKFRHN